MSIAKPPCLMRAHLSLFNSPFEVKKNFGTSPFLSVGRTGYPKHVDIRKQIISICPRY
jgi:hypothetical protein